RVHDLTARDWPDGAFGSRLALDLTGRLSPTRRSAEQDHARPFSDDQNDVAAPRLGQAVPHATARRAWYHEGLRLVAGVLVLVAVGALLAAAFGGQLFGDRSGVPATQPNAPQSIFDLDPDLKQAHRLGWGRDVNQTQTSAGFRVTLRWVGSDDAWIFVVLDIASP